MVLVIPAYNPDYHLLDTLKSLKETLNNRMIIVNDGSVNNSEVIFKEASKYGVILTHKVNKGKGAAMKTAMKYILENMKNENGVIFVDADNQHKAHDVKRMIDAFNNNKDSLILGCRVFDLKQVPIRSRIGNKITRTIFKLYTHVYVSDTQTGLRCISTKYIPYLLKIEGNRFDYEMNMLVNVCKKKINITEVPIDTVYEDKKNSTSHFKVFKDSFLIYKVFLKFIIVSISSFALDYILFLLFTLLLGKNGIFVILSNVFARLISASFNYILNKNIVFKGENKSLPKYILLCLAILIMNSTLLYLLTNLINIIPWIAKIIVEVFLFLISFNLREKYVFKEKYEEKN